MFLEWGIAAGPAVPAAAGGQMLTIDGGAFRYGKPGFGNPRFVAWGCAPVPAANGGG